MHLCLNSRDKFKFENLEFRNKREKRRKKEKNPHYKITITNNIISDNRSIIHVDFCLIFEI